MNRGLVRYVLLLLLARFGVRGGSEKEDRWDELTRALSLRNDVEIHSKEPLLFTVPNFVGKETCEALISAQRDMYAFASRHASERWCLNRERRNMFEHAESQVIDRIDINDEDKAADDTWCTNDPSTLSRIDNDVRFKSTGNAITFWGSTKREFAEIVEIERQLESRFGLNSSYGAPSQLLFYNEGASYRAHLDCGGDLSGHVKSGNERIYSVIVYLNDVAEGGETVFVNLPPFPLRIRPKCGTALIWRSLHGLNRTCTNATLHRADPVISGTKVAYQRWFHVREGRYDAFYEKFQRTFVVSDLFVSSHTARVHSSSLPRFHDRTTRRGYCR